MSVGRWTCSKIAELRKPHSENIYVSDSIGTQAIALRKIARRKTPVQRCRLEERTAKATTSDSGIVPTKMYLRSCGDSTSIPNLNRMREKTRPDMITEQYAENILARRITKK